MTAASIAHLRVKLDDVEAGSRCRWRFAWIACTLCCRPPWGWTNSHLYEIRAGEVGWGSPDPYFGDGLLDAGSARLVDVVEDVGVRSLKYLYDFGDGWEHSVRIERITDAAPGIVYPRLVEAAGRCPPEDIGGPWGYREFLDAVADPNHQQHAERLQWIGGHFDPTDVNAELLAQAVHTLAKKWTRRPAARSRT